MNRYLQVVTAIAASMALQGCVGVGAWTLGSRSESSDRPHIDQTRGSVNLHKKTEGTLTTASALREQWGEPDRVVVDDDGGSSEWIYKTNGFRWSGLVLYVVIIPLPAMIPTGSQYVSVLVHNERVERVTLTDWAFKAGVYCGFFGLMYGGWGCGAGTFEELQTTAASGK
jgi:hypothetical protein